jgi:hypothetical protein
VSEDLRDGRLGGLTIVWRRTKVAVARALLPPFQRAHGREIHGQPAKLGEPRLECRGNLIVGMVARNGIMVIVNGSPATYRVAAGGCRRA